MFEVAIKGNNLVVTDLESSNVRLEVPSHSIHFEFNDTEVSVVETSQPYRHRTSLFSALIELCQDEAGEQFNSQTVREWGREYLGFSKAGGSALSTESFSSIVNGSPEDFEINPASSGVHAITYSASSVVGSAYLLLGTTEGGSQVYDGLAMRLTPTDLIHEITLPLAYGVTYYARVGAGGGGSASGFVVTWKKG